MVRYSLWRVVFLSAERADSASMPAEYVFALGSACLGRDSACVVKSSIRRSLSAEDGGLEISNEDVATPRSSVQMSVLAQASLQAYHPLVTRLSSASSSQTSSWARDVSASSPNSFCCLPPYMLMLLIASASASLIEWKRDRPSRWARISRAVSGPMGDDAGAAWSSDPSKVKTWPFCAAAAAQYSDEATKPQESFMVAASDGVGMRIELRRNVTVEVAASKFGAPCVGAFTRR
jgi:hypothetical protein